MCAQASIWWTTGTGDGAAAYTQAQVIRWLRHWFNFKPQDQGVFLNGAQTGSPGGELAVTPGAGQVSVAAGAACVYGFPYINDAAYAVAIPTPTGNTRIDRIVLRADWTAQTVRITRLAGTEGTGSPPSIIQTDGVTWDLKLAQVQVTTGGVITILSDERQFIHPAVRIGVENLDNQAVTAASIAAAVAGNGLSGGAGSALAVNVDGATIEINADTLRVKDSGITAAKLAAAVAGNGLSGGGGSALAVNVDGVTIEINADTLRVKDEGISAAKLANRTRKFFVQPHLGSTVASISWEGKGYQLRDAQEDLIVGIFHVPSDYVSGLTIKPLAWGPAGNCYCRTSCEIRAVGEDIQQHQIDQGWGIQAMVLNRVTAMRPYDISGTVAAGDVVSMVFARLGYEPSDTLNGAAYAMGFLIEYTADS